jgi:mRNA-degrading endonuclease RelE of RelBE toxin-antitoxin system
MKSENSFVFTPLAERKFRKLERMLQERVRLKLRELKRHDDIGSVLKPMTNFRPATHRLRIGQYRVILQRISEHEFLVIDIGNRSDIYR